MVFQSITTRGQVGALVSDTQQAGLAGAFILTLVGGDHVATEQDTAMDIIMAIIEATPEVMPMAMPEDTIMLIEEATTIMFTVIDQVCASIIMLTAITIEREQLT